MMLVNILRLMGGVKNKKASRNFVTRPTQVILIPTTWILMEIVGTTNPTGWETSSCMYHMYYTELR